MYSRKTGQGLFRIIKSHAQMCHDDFILGISDNRGKEFFLQMMSCLVPLKDFEKRNNFLWCLSVRLTSIAPWILSRDFVHQTFRHFPTLELSKKYTFTVTIYTYIVIIGATASRLAIRMPSSAISNVKNKALFGSPSDDTGEKNRRNGITPSIAIA